jgi:hypothetical protein
VCIIIDANVAHKMAAETEDAKPVVDWVTEGDGHVVTGGKNWTELFAVTKLRRWLRALSQAGRLQQIAREDVAAQQAIVEATNLCVSDDPHVVALARVSKVRLLYSEDQALHTDFQNRELVPTPKGRIYQVKEHKHLLHSRHCP